jgi:glycosyltransferase involved in cell wall biosynthesis
LRFLGLWSKWQERSATRKGSCYEGYVRTDRAFAEKVAQLPLPAHDAFFGYSYASLEALSAEKKRGRLTIVDQIDPGPVEFRLVAEEMSRHPHLAGLPGEFPAGHFDRARREWELADAIVVNSEWTREAIVSEGADPEKIEIVPLAYEVQMDARTEDSDKRSTRSFKLPLRVLWLGQVNVRKGIHYLLEAARLLEREPVEFRVAGPMGIRPEAAASASKNIQWLGMIPRSDAARLYQQSDIFVLPTLSDGFAITQLEAMAHGLPVIVTPNCGRVVEDGVSGFIIPPRNAAALAEAIMRFVLNPGLRAEASAACRDRARVFSVEAYSRKLARIIQERLNIGSGAEEILDRMLN